VVNITLKLSSLYHFSPSFDPKWHQLIQFTSSETSFYRNIILPSIPMCTAFHKGFKTKQKNYMDFLLLYAAYKFFLLILDLNSQWTLDWIRLNDGLLSHHLYYMQNIATNKIYISKCSSATCSPPATLMKSSPDALYTSMYLLPMWCLCLFSAISRCSWLINRTRASPFRRPWGLKHKATPPLQTKLKRWICPYMHHKGHTRRVEL